MDDGWLRRRGEKLPASTLHLTAVCAIVLFTCACAFMFLGDISVSVADSPPPPLSPLLVAGCGCGMVCGVGCAQ